MNCARFRCLLPFVAVLATLAVSLCAPAQAVQHPSFQIAATYDAMQSNLITGSRFWLQGGSVQIDARFYKGLSVVADLASSHTASSGAPGVGLDMVTATFGPRYSFRRGRSRVFGQALAGEAFAFNTVIPGLQGVDTSDDALALLLGGGMDFKLENHLLLRPVEAYWLRTTINNSASNVQNSLRLGAGLVFSFR